MKNRIQVKIQESITPVNFPEFCIYCDRSVEKQKKHTFKFKERISDDFVDSEVEFDLPYCKKHANIFQRNKVLDTIILGLCTLIGLVVVFLFDDFLFSDLLPGWLILSAPGYTVLITGVVISLILYFPLNFILGLVLKLVSGFPLDNPLGIWISYLHESKTLIVEIDNDEFAQRFESFGDKFPSHSQLSYPEESKIPELDQSAEQQVDSQGTPTAAEISGSSETAKENTSVCPKCQQVIETYEFTCPHCGHTQWGFIGCMSVIGFLAGGFVIFRVIRENTTGFLFWAGVVLGVLFIALTIQNVFLAIKLSK